MIFLNKAVKITLFKMGCFSCNNACVINTNNENFESDTV